MSKKTEEKYDYMVKVLVIGDSGVGKTNMITRFSQNYFKQSYVATIGVDFKIKTLNLEGKKLKMQVWDTAGQQRFKNITQVYYKGAAGIILAFSIIDQKSFDNIEKWIQQIQTSAPSDVCKVLVGTKADLQKQRVISAQSANQLAQKFGISYIEVSSKSGLNVNQAFANLGKSIKAKCENMQIEQTNGRKLETPPANDKKSCAC